MLVDLVLDPLHLVGGAVDRGRDHAAGLREVQPSGRRSAARCRRWRTCRRRVVRIERTLSRFASNAASELVLIELQAAGDRVLVERRGGGAGRDADVGREVGARGQAGDDVGHRVAQRALHGLQRARVEQRCPSQVAERLRVRCRTFCSVTSAVDGVDHGVVGVDEVRGALGGVVRGRPRSGRSSPCVARAEVCFRTSVAPAISVVVRVRLATAGRRRRCRRSRSGRRRSS